MKIRHLAGLAIAALLALATPLVYAQAISVPQVTKINPTDLFQDIVNGTPTSGNVYASATTLAGFGVSQATKLNALIGGDASTNLFQRATTGASVTTTLTYGGPDRWAYWSGTGTAMTVSRTTTAADLPASGYSAGFKMARTAAQTGVVQSCMMQVVETVNASMFQGATAEIDFHAVAGATYSAANSALSVYLITGTGSNEGAAAAAFGLNAGGGAGAAWTGQVNTADVATISTAVGRYAAIFAVPSTTTELAVAFCFTPVGTAGANDYVSLSGIQLTRNAALASSASLTTATDCTTINCSSYDRRLQGTETELQQRYYYQLTETAAITPVAPCAAIDTTHTNCLVQFPVPMRTAPALTFANGFATPTSTTQATLGACTTLAAAVTVTSTVANVLNALVNCTATTVPAAGVASFLYSNNGTGIIRANAEL
jgi:hypothetical protein